MFVGTAALGVGLAASPASAEFAGVCTPTDEFSGVCVIDEPEGQNEATHGTATYEIVGDEITFTFDEVEAITTMQVCMVEDTGQDNPFVPTDANTCAGANDPRVYEGDFVDPFVFDLNDLDGWEEGDPIFFAIHFIQEGMTTYIVGGGDPGTTPTTETPTTETPTTETPTTETPTTATPTTAAQVFPTSIARGPTTTLATQVSGVQQQRTLPRTGSADLSFLALVGVLLVVGGAHTLRVATRPQPF